MMAEKGTGLPEISVLMPAYNAERYIEAAIRSLEEQTVENWELIVVDDCSTDGTAQLLRRLAAEDPRIRPIFSAENRGAAASRNLALEQCRGSYVALLDADDLWRPRKLERQLALAEKTGADIVYCSYALIDEAGEKNGAPFVVRETTDFEKMLVCNTLSCSTVFIKREAMRPFDTRFYHEDYALWLELLRDGCRAVGTAEVLADYRILPGSRSNNKWKSARHRWEIYRDLLGLSPVKRSALMLRYTLSGLKKYADTRL